MSVQAPTGPVARWELLIHQFDFNIFHRPGVSNGNAGALSRRPYGTLKLDDLHSPGFQSKPVHDFQRTDPDLWELIDYLESEHLRVDNAGAKRILLSEDIGLLGDYDLLCYLDLSN